jgi:TonB family protein
MNVKRNLIHFGIFVSTLLFGCLGAWLTVSSVPVKRTEIVTKQPQIVSVDRGSGCGECEVTPTETTEENVPSKIVGLKVISKQRPNYTEEARQNNVQGTVRLRVTFLASGQIGAISTISGLPDGLTEQAIAAARQIQFEPAKRNGQPISVVKTVEYSFTLY